MNNEWNLKERKTIGIDSVCQLQRPFFMQFIRICRRRRRRCRLFVHFAITYQFWQKSTKLKEEIYFRCNDTIPSFEKRFDLYWLYCFYIIINMCIHYTYLNAENIHSIFHSIFETKHTHRERKRKNTNGSRKEFLSKTKKTNAKWYIKYKLLRMDRFDSFRIGNWNCF